MNKPAFNFLKRAILYTFVCVSSFLATSCVEDIPEENRFTWTGELISTYLEKQPEKYSKFITILKKANISKKAESSLFQTLSTYGSYTCFAPTNAAVDEFLAEMCKNPEESKITSTDVEMLSDSVATEIAKNHIIELGYKADKASEGNFPKNTMNRRSVKLSLTSTGRFLLDDQAEILEVDIETENGIIQTINKVLNPSTKKIHEQILQHKELSLFGQAIMETGLDELLNIYELTSNYEPRKLATMHIAMEGKAYSPEEHRQRYTILMETDELLANPENNHLGISIQTLEDLEKLAQEFYGKEAPGDYKNEKNALHQYIRYHIIDRQLFYEGSAPGGFIMEGYTNSGGGFSSEVNLPTIFDRYDYFETMLPYTMIKVTKPFTNEALKNDIIINYAQEKGTLCVNPNMAKYLNVKVLRREDSGVENFDQKAINGTLHVTDKILIYNNDEMAGNVLNERMRWDVSSLFPELTNNSLRWEDNSGEDNSTTYIPEGYCKRLVINGIIANTVILYLRPHSTGKGGYPNYQGDELLALGRYDFSYRIPHVPEGDYEIRFGYSVSGLRAITQFYFDGNVCGIPVDMGLGSDKPLIGWEEDKESAEENKELDKTMRNRFYMKGPASCHLDKDGNSMRDSGLALRKIIGTYRLDKGDHWIRFKNVTDDIKRGNDYVQFNQDYLEIVPTNIINNPAKPEDQY